MNGQQVKDVREPRAFLKRSVIAHRLTIRYSLLPADILEACG
jgi:hypothetical protein